MQSNTKRNSYNHFCRRLFTRSLLSKSLIIFLNSAESVTFLSFDLKSERIFFFKSSMSIGLQFISGAAIKMQNIKPNIKEFILLNYSFAWIEFIKNLWLFICNIKRFYQTYRHRI
jgi:hypothetical protein